MQQTFNGLPVEIDVKNQARVHLWYKEHFGYDLPPYISVERAINTWPTTATSIGVKMQNDAFVVYAPFGYLNFAPDTTKMRIKKKEKADIFGSAFSNHT